ncbi:hypothetical protein VPH35_110518 [Triticum aestivum]
MTALSTRTRVNWLLPRASWDPPTAPGASHPFSPFASSTHQREVVATASPASSYPHRSCFSSSALHPPHVTTQLSSSYLLQQTHKRLAGLGVADDCTPLECARP